MYLKVSIPTNGKYGSINILGPTLFLICTINVRPLVLSERIAYITAEYSTISANNKQMTKFLQPFLMYYNRLIIDVKIII